MLERCAKGSRNQRERTVASGSVYVCGMVETNASTYSINTSSKSLFCMPHLPFDRTS